MRPEASVHGVQARRGELPRLTPDTERAPRDRGGDGSITAFARSGATGLLVMTIIYSIGNVSGAHFNPAVTAAFAMRGVFPWRRVPLYWMAQLVGAFLGAGLPRWMFGNVEHLAATLPSFGVARGFGMEVVLTMILVAVVLGTATRHRSVGTDAAIASGGAVALCSLFSRPVSGASDESGAFAGTRRDLGRAARFVDLPSRALRRCRAGHADDARAALAQASIRARGCGRTIATAELQNAQRLRRPPTSGTWRIARTPYASPMHRKMDR
jgi:hypothetical protein